jgi:hypothetical protein
MFLVSSLSIDIDGVVVLDFEEAAPEADLFLKDWGTGW